MGPRVVPGARDALVAPQAMASVLAEALGVPAPKDATVSAAGWVVQEVAADRNLIFVALRLRANTIPFRRHPLSVVSGEATPRGRADSDGLDHGSLQDVQARDEVLGREGGKAREMSQVRHGPGD